MRLRRRKKLGHVVGIAYGPGDEPERWVIRFEEPLTVRDARRIRDGMVGRYETLNVGDDVYL